MQEYIRFTRGEILTVLKTWKSLQAYRATVPVSAVSTSTELYFLNVAIALEVVGKQIAAGPAVLVRRTRRLVVAQRAAKR